MRKTIFWKDSSVETPFAVASVTGAGNWINSNNLVFELKTKDGGKIPPLFGPGNMQFSAQMNGQLSGPHDSLKISSELNIAESCVRHNSCGKTLR